MLIKTRPFEISSRRSAYLLWRHTLKEYKGPLLLLLVAVLFSVGIRVYYQFFPQETYSGLVVVPVFCVQVAVVVFVIWSLFRVFLAPVQAIMVNYVLLTETALTVEDIDGVNVTLPWTAIQRVYAMAGYWLIELPGMQISLIPEVAFQTRQDQEEWVNFLKDRNFLPL